jgi:hypothetical protein
MPGVGASALSGSPVVARASSFNGKNSRGNNSKKCATTTTTGHGPSSRSSRSSSSSSTLCAIHESSGVSDAATSQQHIVNQDGDSSWCEDGENCPITPRQIVNGLELPLFEDVSTAHFRIRSGVVRTR